jgi:hypothetical protein
VAFPANLVVAVSKWIGFLLSGSSALLAESHGWAIICRRIKQARTEKGDRGYWQYIQRSKNPEVPVVVLEDSAALVGLFFAYLGVGLTVLTGNSVF